MYPSAFDITPTVAPSAPAIQVLDGFSLRCAGVDVPLPEAAQRLIVYLCVAGRIPRCVLSGRLWPDVPERYARASLRTALWHLSQRAPGVVEICHGTVQLMPAVAVDLVDLRRSAWFFIERGAHERVDFDQPELVSLLGSCELLPGWSEEWLEDLREDVRQLRMHALEALSRMLLEDGRHALALHAAMEVARMEPLRETAASAVIAVHLAERNVIEAVKYFDAFSHRLATELGVRPSEELKNRIPTGRLRQQERLRC